jgi:hypothetical protein
MNLKESKTISPINVKKSFYELLRKPEGRILPITYPIKL